MENLLNICREKFKHMSNEQLIAQANNAPDFGWDDEGTELRRRKDAGLINYKMNGNKLIPIK